MVGKSSTSIEADIPCRQVRGWSSKVVVWAMPSGFAKIPCQTEVSRAYHEKKRNGKVCSCYLSISVSVLNIQQKSPRTLSTVWSRSKSCLINNRGLVFDLFDLLSHRLVAPVSSHAPARQNSLLCLSIDLLFEFVSFWYRYLMFHCPLRLLGLLAFSSWLYELRSPRGSCRPLALLKFARSSWKVLILWETLLLNASLGRTVCFEVLWLLIVPLFFHDQKTIGTVQK